MRTHVGDAGSPGDVDVGIVVVTFNSADVVGGLLDSLQVGLRGLAWRAVFVDNASSDDTVAAVTAAGFEVLACDANRGYAAAINRGVGQLPGARAILVLNPDVALMPGSVAAMSKVLDDDSVGVVAPMIRPVDDRATPELSQRREPTLLRTWGTALLGGRLSRTFSALSEQVGDLRCYQRATNIDWATGAALLIRRRCLDIVGDWDESYFLYSEETDFCRRVRAAGFVVRYTPGAVVRHVGGGGRSQPRLRAMMVVNKVREYRRRRGSIAAWCFFVGNLVHELTRALAGRRESLAAAVALVSPRRRPSEIGASGSLMPP